MGGDRITVQLDRWRKVLVALTALTGCDPIAPSHVSGGETTGRLRNLGFPRQTLLISDVLIPNPSETSEVLRPRVRNFQNCWAKKLSGLSFGVASPWASRDLR